MVREAHHTRVNKHAAVEVHHMLIVVCMDMHVRMCSGEALLMLHRVVEMTYGKVSVRLASSCCVSCTHVDVDM